MMYALSQHSAWIMLMLLPIVIWELVWKGLGLWHSARYKQKAWFVAILIFNTVGLLPIIYLLWFRPKKESAPKRTTSMSVRKVVARKKAAKK